MIGKAMSLIPNDINGYKQVQLRMNGKRLMKLVHVLVLEAFVGPRPHGKESAHWNGVRDDNRISNLRWATRSENNKDRVRHGTIPCGEKHGKAKLNDRVVREARRLRRYGLSFQSIADRFGVTDTVIRFAIIGRTWKHV